MQYQFDVNSGQVVANSSDDLKVQFYRRTYLHVAAYMAIFAGLIAGMMVVGIDQAMMQLMASSKWVYLGIMMAFMFGVGIVEGFVARTQDVTMKYVGAGACLLLYALFSVALISFVVNYTTNVLPTAVLITLSIAVALSVIAFTTRKDFSFLRSGLMMVGIAMVVMIVASIAFGFELGSWFSIIGILYASGCLLYTTSNMIHHYTPDQYIEASVQLFGSLWLLFMYVLQLLMSFLGDE